MTGGDRGSAPAYIPTFGDGGSVLYWPPGGVAPFIGRPIGCDDQDFGI